MNRELLPQQTIGLLLVTLSVLSVSGCGAMQSLFATPPTNTDIPPTRYVERFGRFVRRVRVRGGSGQHGRNRGLLPLQTIPVWKHRCK
jgi:hypothetical protein